MQQQLAEKQYRKQEEESMLKSMEQKIIGDRLQSKWWDRMNYGAPIKDGEGNVLNTRGHPRNPNFQTVDWFTHSTVPVSTLKIPSTTKEQKQLAQSYL